MYRVRVEDRHGDRWSFNASTVEAAIEIAVAQNVTIVWLRRV